MTSEYYTFPSELILAPAADGGIASCLAQILVENSEQTSVPSLIKKWARKLLQNIRKGKNLNKKTKLELAKQYIDAYNNFDVVSMLESLHVDVEFKNFANGEVTLHVVGLAAFRAQAEDAVKLFSERRQTIRSLAEKDLCVLAEIYYEATLAQDLGEKMKAGDKINLNGSSEFHFQDGKIRRIIDRS